MSTVDSTIVATGLPTIRSALHTRLNWAAWTITAYQLGLVVSMPLAGRISDQLGHKRVFVWAAVIFTVTSLLCGISTNIVMLIALRVIQAIGGGAFMPAASGIVSDVFGDQRRRALGLFTSIFPLGTLAGPIAGGFIIADWSWRGLFLAVVPFGLVFTVLAIRYLPTSPPKGGRADLVGALAFGATILGLALAISELGNPHTGLLSGQVLTAITASVVAGGIFLRRLFRVNDPLIPLELLRGRGFLASNTINFMWGSCAIGFGSLVPLFGQERYHLTPLASGTLLSARAVGEGLFAILASLLIHRSGFRVPLITGIAVLSCGLVMISIPAIGVGPYLWLSGAAAITGIGIGLSAPAANIASIELAPNNVGAIIGIRGAARQSGGIIGIAVATAAATRSSHEAQTLGRAFLVLGVLLFAIIPLAFLVPNGNSRPRLAAAPIDPPNTS
jgi:EmrB/QacA subfamily drug resistance transporter